MTDSVHPHIVLFDLYAGGHNGQYVDNLVRYWVDHGLNGKLDVIVPTYFMEAYPDLARYIKEHGKHGIGVVPIEEKVDVYETRRFRLIRFDRTHRRMLKTYLTRVRPDHCLLMSMDHVQLSLAMDMRFSFPVALSGIYFRGSFHYGDYEMPPSEVPSIRNRWQKKILLKGALRNPHFNTLFCLDPGIVSHVRAFDPDCEIFHLPDGLSFHDDGLTGDTLKKRWKLTPGRTTAVMFGALTARKGLFKVLESLPKLPKTIQSKLAVVLAGRIEEAHKKAVLDLVGQCRRETDVQLVVDDRFLPDGEIPGVLRAADLAFVAYQRHVGSSNVLIRAAAEAVPVLGSEWGLVGEQIRRHRLGCAVDTTSSDEIARKLQAFIENPDQLEFDASSALAFAASNSAEQFARIIFDHLGSPKSGS